MWTSHFSVLLDVSRCSAKASSFSRFVMNDDHQIAGFWIKLNVFSYAATEWAMMTATMNSSLSKNNTYVYLFADMSRDSIGIGIVRLRGVELPHPIAELQWLTARSAENQVHQLSCWMCATWTKPVSIFFSLLFLLQDFRSHPNALPTDKIILWFSIGRPWLVLWFVSAPQRQCAHCRCIALHSTLVCACSNDHRSHGTTEPHDL